MADSQTTLVLPIVHLNGTSRQALIDLRCDAGRALRLAQDALSAMSPNGRDYYPVTGLFEQAMRQHERRAKILADLYAELEAEVIALDDLP